MVEQDVSEEDDIGRSSHHRYSPGNIQLTKTSVQHLMYPGDARCDGIKRGRGPGFFQLRNSSIYSCSRANSFQARHQDVCVC